MYYKNDLLRLQGLVNLLILIFQVPFLFSFPLLIRLIGLLFGFWLLFKDIKYFHKLRLFFRFKFSYEADLLTMAYEQGLAHSKFMYRIEENLFHFRIFKDYTPELAKVEALDKPLMATLNLPLKSKIVNEQSVDYYFQLKKPERLVYNPQASELTDDLALAINLGYGMVYNPAKAPHILVSGGTGSGKSVFISFLVLELLKRKSDLYVVDPKHSDLSALKSYLPDGHVATSLNEIAKATRLVVEEMQRRYDEMNAPENFKYGSNFQGHNYRSVWLLFDELAGFQAMGATKEARSTIQEVMNNLTQIVLLGRQAGCFLLFSAQQMNSNTLPTELRDNLGCRIALGANSSEGYRMVFGGHIPEVIPQTSVKGSGLIYIDGTGKQEAEYWEAPFMDMKKFNFLDEIKKLCDLTNSSEDLASNKNAL
ncbi:FtsK/SpoIIIE domain-containing protein [Oenococcus kitaharae]|uniref:FtsK/SpoIIIE domain-containing protein n=1 Tax=Oenococcus kitaharae TaxID=336988 RepID=UPI00145DC369|nr:FtsK/SpoIIIE domain-containing protein [Oenococcus kitaharae]